MFYIPNAKPYNLMNFYMQDKILVWKALNLLQFK